MNQNIYYPKA